MDYNALAAFLLIGLISWIILCWRGRSPSARLPPGPFSFPLVGSLLSLKEPLHQHFANLSRKYGPLVYLKLGMAPIVVANSSEMAALVLKAHDLEFSSRPNEEYFRLLSHDFEDLGMAPVGRKWKTMRRICSTHLFSNNMLKSSAGFRESEMKNAMKLIRQHSGTEVNLRRVFNSLLTNSLCQVLFSDTNLDLADLVRAAASLSLNLNIGILIPALDRFDLHGIYKKVNTELLPRIKKQIDDQIQKHRLEKQRAGDNFTPRDFTDVLISLKEDELSDISKMALLFDMVIAGLETGYATMEWTMAELINHPETMAKAQEEIDRVVGRERKVQESDLPELYYTEAVLKESMRLHPALPLGLPHKNLVPVNLDGIGYTIPANCKVLVNIWAIGRDPGRWSDPDHFRPDRFLSSNISVSGQQFDFIPFSSGRRICVGYPLAMRSISYFVASLIQAFDWKSGKNGIDMTETTRSTTLNMSSDLVAVASPRVDQTIFEL